MHKPPLRLYLENDIRTYLEIMYTDGLLETFSPEGKPFGMHCLLELLELLSTLTCPQCGYRQTHAIINQNWNDPVSDAKRQ